MSIIRVSLAPDFLHGEDVVLVAMTRNGLEAFSTTIEQALEQGRSRLDHAGTTHEVRIHTGDSGVELTDRYLAWQFDSSTTKEVIDKLTALKAAEGPAHQYVDISSPVDTLVLSLDEYVAT